MKQAIQRLEILVMIFAVLVSCLAGFSVSVGAADAPNVVRDGLVIWYDASNNSNGAQDREARVWRDLSGNGHHMTIHLNETNYWTDKSFHVNEQATYFPDAVLDIVNGKEYTIEFVTGELSYNATDWITFISSDNDEFSLFVRQELDVLEYKYNDDNRDRPRIADGGKISQNATIAVTFKMTSTNEGVCYVYVNGELRDEAVPIVTNIADSLLWGQESPRRAWSGDVYGFRFYNRVLTADEVKANATSDAEKYRSENTYPPQVEYNNPDEIISEGDDTPYVNDRVPFTSKSDVIPKEGYYGVVNADKHLYPDEGDAETWEGARIALDPASNDWDINFYVDYQKFVRKAGLERLTAQDVNYIVLKVKIDGMLNDLAIYPCAGSVNSVNDGAKEELSMTLPECTGDEEYLVYRIRGSWNGLINRFKLVAYDVEEGSTLYLQEMALFKTQEEAEAYIEAEQATEPVETEPVTEPMTEPVIDPVTEDVSTESPTEASTKDESRGSANGCRSAIGFGTTAILLAVAAAFVLKKKI